MNLFKWNAVMITLHSGKPSHFKIDCDALTRWDCDAAARTLAPILPVFSTVEAVPSTGPVSRWLAQAFMPFCDKKGPTLIVDDVFTTGASLEAQRNGRDDCLGAVLFARGRTPDWVTALFTLNERCW